MSKELDYILKRKKVLSKKMDRDNNALELTGDFISSDKQFLGWVEEYNILQSIETKLKRLEKIDNEPVVPIHINRYNELSAKEDVLEIIKSFNDYQIVEVQGQWYLMRGIEFGKSIKMPITKEQADLLKEILWKN